MAQRMKIVLDEGTRNMVITIAIAVGTLILCYSIYKTHADKIKQLHAGIYEENRRLIIRKDLAKIDSIINEYRKHLSQDMNSNIFRETISALARGLDVDIVSMQPPTAINVDRYIIYSIKIKVNCSYNMLGKFLERIERLSALATVDELIINEGSFAKSNRALGEAYLEKEAKVFSALTITTCSPGR